MEEQNEHMKGKDPHLYFGKKSSEGFFEVPKGFFEAQQTALEDKIEQEILREQAPILFSLAKTPFFLVPEGFFKDFPSTLKERLKKEESGNIKGVSTDKYREFFPYQLAAAITIVLLGVWLFIGGPRNEISPVDNAPTLLSDIPTQALIEAVAMNDMDSHILMDALEAEGIDDLPLDIFPEIWELEGEEWDILQGIDMFELDLEDSFWEKEIELY